MNNKYKAIRIKDSAGRSFASRGERDCYAMLLLLEAAKEITIIGVQVSVYLTEARIHYIADFMINDYKLGREVWIEYKGFETPVWRLKRKLWQYYGPGPLRIYKGYGLKMNVTEEIIPK